MKKLLILPLLFLAFFISNKVNASHIVGGEIVITYVQPTQYVLTMNLYRDQSGIAAPPTAQIEAFQRQGLNNVGSWTLPLMWDSVVPPQISGCAGQQVVIERYFYQDTVILNPSTFNHPSGYIFRWTSCCRNGGVVNLQASSSAGQNTATLFPPIQDQGGNQIINSTPQLFPPLADYGCVGQLYYQPFGGSDPDGDSLSYTLYTPFDDGAPLPGVTSAISPIYSDPSTMFPAVAWANCYNVDNQINGFSDGSCTSLTEPDRLSVDPVTGFVTVTPSLGPAYFVIGVWCQEWRDIDNDGTKDLIGSVFRDFQLQVSDPSVCQPQVPVNPPVPIDPPGVTLSDTIFIPGVVGDRCVTYQVSDPGAGSAVPNGVSNVEIIVDAINFPDSTVNLTPEDLQLLAPTDTIDIELCFGDCAFSQNGEPLELNIIYVKEHCPQPFFDTIKVFFLVEEIPTPQNAVYLSDADFPAQFLAGPANDTIDIQNIEFFIRPNWEIDLELNVVDSLASPDSLLQYIIYNNDTLNYQDYGMELIQYAFDSLLPPDSVVQADTIYGQNAMKTHFRWKPDCALFDPGALLKDTIVLITEDKYCGQNQVRRNLIFNILNINEDPIVTAVPGDSTETTELDIEPIETMTFLGSQIPQAFPILYDDVQYSAEVYSFTKRVGTDRSIGGSGKKEGESLVFDIKAADPDKDEVFTKVYFKENGVFLGDLDSRTAIADLGMSTGRTNIGIGEDSLISNFNWDSRYITCEALEYAPVELMVVTTDSSCFQAQDVAFINIGLDNGTPPQMQLFQDLDDGTEEIQRNAEGNVEITFSSEDLSFFVTGFDNDLVDIGEDDLESDKVRLSVTLDGKDINDTEDVFNAKNIDAVYRNPLRYVEKGDTIFFFWDPACEDREVALEPLKFKVHDNACPINPNDPELGLRDSMTVEILPVGEFEAINVITANNDGYNDYLELYAIDQNSSSGELIIEPMQCGFESIKVYNRYGQVVFQSEEKDFKWGADNVPAGDYFYEMKFGNRTYKSYLKVLK